MLPFFRVLALRLGAIHSSTFCVDITLILWYVFVVAGSERAIGDFASEGSFVYFVMDTGWPKSDQ